MAPAVATTPRGPDHEGMHFMATTKDTAYAQPSTPDPRIEAPAEEELLAACEHALEWFEQWERHADHANDFGGEHRVMQKLRRALAEVWIREEL